MKKFSFKKKERLRLRKDFTRIFKTGRSFANECLVMYIKKREEVKDKSIQIESRIGIIVKRRIGISVIRNRIKRLIREFFRLNKEKIVKPVDIIVIVRKKMETLNYQQMEKSGLDIWKKAKII